MRKQMTSLLKRGRKLVEDNLLLTVLQSEINHEISNPRFQDVKKGSLGDFKLDYDSPETRDIVLRRQFESGEEVVVSALLDQEAVEDDEARVFPRDARAKVCIKKPGISSILQFHCWVADACQEGSDRTTSIMGVESVSFIHSLASYGTSTCEENFNRADNYNLEDALKEYLVSRGINEELINFLMYHLNKKEQDQYLEWLRKLESIISHSQKP